MGSPQKEGDLIEDFVIRRARVSDTPEIFRIVQDLQARGIISTTDTFKMYRQSIKRSKLFLVLESQGKVVAFLKGSFKREIPFLHDLRLLVSRHHRGNFYYLFQICVDPIERRKGYGRALNEYLFQHLPPDCPVFLSIDNKNYPSITFHQSIGYRFVELFQPPTRKEPALKLLYVNDASRFRAFVQSK